jgi:hypothetical protein
MDKEQPNQSEEQPNQKEEEPQRKRKHKPMSLKKYSEMINYPGLNVEMQPVVEPDTELFNNLFNENQVICQNNIKRYIYCSTIFILYAAIGFMFYKFVY